MKLLEDALDARWPVVTLGRITYTGHAETPCETFYLGRNW